MLITPEQLSSVIGNNPYLNEWCDGLNKILPHYDITTPSRIASFLAQTAHESGKYRVLEENLNYRASSLMRVWPKHFPTEEIANEYARQPERIANRAYRNRMDNGDEASGDGWRYRGRGLIQLTGKYNYSKFAESVGMDLADVPEYLESFEGAIAGACWFWDTNKLNRYADAGDIKTMTKRINGGYIGLEDRIHHYHEAMHAMGAEVPEASVVLETVKRGSRGPTVQKVQEKLGITPADGIFGPGTERIVKQWQSDNGLVADGIVGPNTLGKLLG